MCCSDNSDLPLYLRGPGNSKREFAPGLARSSLPRLRFALLLVGGSWYGWFDASNLAAFIADNPDLAYLAAFVTYGGLSYGRIAVCLSPLLYMSFGDLD